MRPVTAEPPNDAAAEYQPVSPLAVGALAVGCCSALALATRFAWAIPLVGVVLAAAALRDVAQPGGRKAGRLAALAALALAVGFGTQAVTGFLVDRWIMASRARAAAGAWIDAVREGRVEEALGLCVASVLPPSSLPPDLGHEEGEAERLRRFSQLPAVAAVARCAANRPPLTHAEPAGSDDGGWILHADLAACGGPTLRLAVVPRRVRGTSGAVERWNVAAVSVDP